MAINYLPRPFGVKGNKHHLNQYMVPVTHMKVNCFVKRRKGKRNKTVRTKLKWDWKEKGGNWEEYRAYVYATQSRSRDVYKQQMWNGKLNSCDSKTFYSWEKQGHPCLLFDSDKHLPILSNLYINCARGFPFIISFFCHLKRMSLNGNHAVILPHE